MKSFLLFVLLLASYLLDAQELLIFGCGSTNKSHEVFLGCLNCSEYSSSSIWNKYGTYGSEYSSQSIWNSYGTYGSPYSDKSPFNKYADCLPAIVDEQGNFYGYLTPSVIYKYDPN